MKIVVKRNMSAIQPNNSNKLPTSKNMGFSKYVLPKVDIIPGGHYYSIIKNVEHSLTWKKEKAITVYYRISPCPEVYKKVNNLLPEGTKITRYYIRQVYPIGSSYYDTFITAMYEELGKSYDEDIEFDEIVGLTELIILSYEKLDGIGGISERCYYKDEDFIDARYLSNRGDKVCEDSEDFKKVPSNSPEEYSDEEYYEDFNFSFFDD